MKNFFAEFKKFITRGNVIDMAVGVTVGSAFTAIVNGLTNFILKPIINWVLSLILGAETLTEMFTFLKPVYLTDEVTGLATPEYDLTNSIYIDWGSFINAILNFLIIAFVLFSIVKVINHIREESDERKAGKITKEERKALKAAGIKVNKANVKAYREELAAKAAEAKALEEAAKAEAERLAKENSTEALLMQIRDLLKNKQ